MEKMEIEVKKMPFNFEMPPKLSNQNTDPFSKLFSYLHPSQTV